MATPENRIARHAAARLAEAIDHTLPAQVEQLLAGKDTHEWATGKRFGADQAVVVTIAGYLIGVVHVAWALCTDPWVELHRPRAGAPEIDLFLAFLVKQIRGKLGAPERIPGYVCDEVISAAIGETIAESERHRPGALPSRPPPRGA